MAEIEIHLSPLSFPEPPPIVVSDESFVIGRETPIFRTWKDARVKRLSREHARLEINGSSASLCDLGSTNGTKINNVPLTAHRPSPIQHGDVISFANSFKYEVKIVRCSYTEDTVVTQVTSEQTRDERIVKNKTMFIASADSYLEMLCEEDDPADEISSLHASGKKSRLWIIVTAAVILVIAGGAAFYLMDF